MRLADALVFTAASSFALQERNKRRQVHTVKAESLVAESLVAES